MDPNGFRYPYVKLQLGRQRFRSKVVKKCLNPSWCAEFTFKVVDLKKGLLVSVLDEDKYFNDDFVGQIKVPVHQVFEAKDKPLGTAWYALHPRNKKSKNKDCGEILLMICLSAIDSFSRSSPLRASSPMRSEDVVSSKEEKLQASTLASRIAQIFNKNADSTSVRSVGATDAFEPHATLDSVVLLHKSDEQTSSVDFEEMMKSVEMKDQGGEVPSSLPGGVVLDQLHGILPGELNSKYFSPNSNFLNSLADIQGSTDYQIGPWKYENNCESPKRVISYTKAPSKLIKALKAIEEQTYLKADAKAFALLSSVSTPDAPYGKTFKTEVLYCITPGPEQTSGEHSSRLEVSWRVNFLQSTLMKGMIEGGARQGIKESFEQFKKLLSQNVKPFDLKDIVSEKEQLLAYLQVEHQSGWKLAVQYFANSTVVSTIFRGLYALTHIWLAMPSTIQGLEFVGLDLPDSVCELIVCGVLVLQGKWVLELMPRFMQARAQKGILI